MGDWCRAPCPSPGQYRSASVLNGLLAAEEEQIPSQ